MSIRDRLRKIFGQRKSVTTTGELSVAQWASESLGFPGSATQFEGAQTGWRQQQLVIGLDFGTAYTKAVIGEARRHFAVPLADGKGLDRYIASSGFYMSMQGDCYLSEVGNASQYVTNLKMKLLQRDFGDSSLVNCSIFVALCLRRVRYWLLASQKDTYLGLRLSWVVNLGLPTDSYEDEGMLDAYRKIARTGWALSVYPGKVNLGAAQKLIEATSLSWAKELERLEIYKGDLIEDDEISLFPEFLAQIAGYVRSPGRQADLHMLVDVGAGTMDATTFNVHVREDEDHFPVFSKSVTEHGVHFLINHRLAGANSSVHFDEFDPVPQTREFAACLNMSEAELDEKDRPFRKLTYDTIGARLVETRKDMYVTSPRWKEGVPVFLCGGGASVDFYQNLLARFSDKDSIRISLMHLPKPRDLYAPDLISEHFNRLSVAYGLSFDPDNLGSTLFAGPDSAKDSLKRKSNWRDTYVDPSQT